jgi:hypothetical protein
VDTHLPRQVQHPGGSGKLGSFNLLGGARMSQVGQLPRPVLIAIVGAVAVAALIFATSHKGGGSSSTSSTPPSTQPAQPKTSSQAGSKAQPGTPAAQSSSPAPTNGGQPAAGSSARTLPSPVKKALDAHKVVVLLFWNPKGADDRSVKQTVDGLSNRGGEVAKFTDTLQNVARYAQVTSTNAVAQTPTVVVVDRKGHGLRATGYLDDQTVDQLVVDALRQ